MLGLHGGTNFKDFFNGSLLRRRSTEDTKLDEEEETQLVDSPLSAREKDFFDEKRPWTRLKKWKSQEDLYIHQDLTALIDLLKNKKIDADTFVQEVVRISKIKFKVPSLAKVKKMNRNPYPLFENYLNLFRVIGTIFNETQTKQGLHRYNYLVKASYDWQKMVDVATVMLMQERLPGASNSRKKEIRKFIKAKSAVERNKEVGMILVAAIGGRSLNNAFNEVLTEIQGRRGLKSLPLEFQSQGIEKEYLARPRHILEIDNIEISVRGKQEKKDPSKFTVLNKQKNEQIDHFLVRLMTAVNLKNFERFSKENVASEIQKIVSMAKDDLCNSSSKTETLSSYGNEESDFLCNSEVFELSRSISENKMDEQGKNEEEALVRISATHDLKSISQEFDEAHSLLKTTVNFYYLSILKRLTPFSIHLMADGIKSNFPQFFEKTFSAKKREFLLKVKPKKRTYAEIRINDQNSAKVSLRKLFSFSLSEVSKKKKRSPRKVEERVKIKVGFMWVQLSFFESTTNLKITDFAFQKRFSKKNNAYIDVIKKAQEWLKTEILKENQ